MEMDLVIKGGKVIFPDDGVFEVDIGVSDGIIKAIGKDLSFSSYNEVINAQGKYVLPGIIDSHTHIGMHENIPVDARTETSAAIAGGITSVLNYYRAGRNNVETEKISTVPESYLKIFPEVLKQSSGNFYTDFGYHLAPVTKQHIEEIPQLVTEYGVTTYKFYMHYLGIKPEDHFDINSLTEHLDFLFSDDVYDLGFLFKIMRKVANLYAQGHEVRVNIHAENPALVRVNKEITKEKAEHESLTPLEAYNLGKPSSVERLGIIEATELSNETGAPITLLHISSHKAVSAVDDSRKIFQNLNMNVETTLHHLTLSLDMFDNSLAKVNPPIRPKSDVDSLWEGLINGSIQTIVTDSAASRRKLKPQDIWKAKPGFGGLDVFLPAIITEGHFKRNIPLEKVIAFITKNPARIHGLGDKKGNIKIGSDADFVLCDLKEERRVPDDNRYSAQDFNLFAGAKMRGFPIKTILRGITVFDGNQVIGKPQGKYLKRPYTYYQSQ